MQLLKLFFSTSFLLLAFTLSGCQGNNSDVSSSGNLPNIPDTNSTAITVVLPTSSAILRTNKQVVTIKVRAFDSAYNPYSSGTITKVNPSSVLNGRDIGTFDKISAPLVNGVASFTYTAPNNLKADTRPLSFGFYHDSDSANIKTFTMSIIPDTHQVVLTSYELKTSTPDDVNMNLNSTKTFSYTVYKKNGTAIQNSQIKSLTVTSLNPALATLADNMGNTGNILSTEKQNAFTVNISSNTKSGLVPIKVDAIFSDANGDEQSLSKIFNMIVFSGPPTAASLGYIGSVFNASTGLYTEQWRLMVVDKYTNLVNTNPSVSSSMIVGYAKDDNPHINRGTGYLYHSINSADGTLSKNGSYGKLTSSTSAFSNVDLVNDKLVIFGTGYKFNAFGKWEIESKSSTVLNLSDEFNSSTLNGLGFAVGHNFRNETCGDHNAVVASVKALNNNRTLNNDGILILEATFNDYMVGKSVILSTNFIGGYNNISGQLGYARKITFVGTGLSSEVYKVTKGETSSVKIKILVNDSPHKITYKNANFYYASVENTAKDTNTTVIGSSMVAGINDCSDGGDAYVQVDIGPAGGDGTVQLVGLLVSREF